MFSCSPWSPCLDCVLPGLPYSFTCLSFVGIWVHGLWIRNSWERLAQVTWKETGRAGVPSRGNGREGTPNSANGPDISGAQEEDDCTVSLGRLDFQCQGFQLHYRAVILKDDREATEPPSQEKPRAPHSSCCFGNHYQLMAHDPSSVPSWCCNLHLPDFGTCLGKERAVRWLKMSILPDE